ncbi:type III-D CRISPR-associated protein Csx19 [Pseudogracilibacillus sp. SO30301A]|uniref:type III-D CRISPR-associated protein Csx19 n=1 Tax=Pseudogracilibacillus sp. SO30301A TaxID=3098291 RepID=UPI00300DF7B0
MKSGETRSLLYSGFLYKEELMGFIKNFKHSYLYLVTDYAVYLGKVQDHEIKLIDAEPDVQLIQEVRIFNQSEETKITRMKDRFVWRTRKDEIKTGKNIIYIDETHKLWGTVTDTQAGWSCLREKRGASIAVPGNFKKGQEIGLVFRKYVEFQDWDLATKQPFAYEIVDERLVNYVNWKEAAKNDNESK